MTPKAIEHAALELLKKSKGEITPDMIASAEAFIEQWLFHQSAAAAVCDALPDAAESLLQNMDECSPIFSAARLAELGDVGEMETQHWIAGAVAAARRAQAHHTGSSAWRTWTEIAERWLGGARGVAAVLRSEEHRTGADKTNAKFIKSKEKAIEWAAKWRRKDPFYRTGLLAEHIQEELGRESLLSPKCETVKEWIREGQNNGSIPKSLLRGRPSKKKM